MSGTNSEGLVDRELIARANEHHTAQVSRLAAAQEQAQTAKKDRDAALAARSDAVEGKGDLSPLNAEQAVEIAERAHRVAALVREAAERAVKEAEEGQRAAEAVAWRPAYLDGVRRRIAAARRAEAAELALTAANKEHEEATAALDEAANHGTPRVEYVHQKPRRLTTEEDELHLWTSNGFDPIAGTYQHWV